MQGGPAAKRSLANWLSFLLSQVSQVTCPGRRERRDRKGGGRAQEEGGVREEGEWRKAPGEGRKSRETGREEKGLKRREERQGGGKGEEAKQI